MSDSATSDDFLLLRRFISERSQDAFAELVSRHLNLVYGCSLRRVAGDVHLAEDVSQQVFVALARQAGSLPEGLVLPAWLFSCTRNIAAQAVRTERRRRIREHQAQLMTALSDDTSPAPDWKLLRPVLDETIDELGERDREAIVLRFFEGYSYSQVGTRLRMTENAARMRVERALDKLHALLARRGIPSTAAAVGLALGGQVLVAAPAGLAGTITSAAVAGSGALAGGGGLVAFMSTIKVQVATIAVAGVVGGSAFTAEFQHQQALRQELTSLQSTNLPLTALQSEQRRLSALTIEVADLLKTATPTRADFGTGLARPLLSMTFQAREAPR